MSVEKIYTVPDPVLYKKCEKVKKSDPELITVAKNLMETLDSAVSPQGAGLAAPQIGILKRVLVARNFFESPDKPGHSIFQNVLFINPRIISHSSETDVDYEGCLSIPNTYGKVQRYKTIKVKTEDLDGQEFTVKASGFFARIIQHEMDHLDGILFTSKLVGNTITEEELDKLMEAES